MSLPIDMKIDGETSKMNYKGQVFSGKNPLINFPFHRIVRIKEKRIEFHFHGFRIGDHPCEWVVRQRSRRSNEFKLLMKGSISCKMDSWDPIQYKDSSFALPSGRKSFYVNPEMRYEVTMQSATFYFMKIKNYNEVVATNAAITPLPSCDEDALEGDISLEQSEIRYQVGQNGSLVVQ
eukprot:TRINITY_DN165_c0_g1_i4.p1 TRINITY_DN165_c0_g1~~TRINITY_DN165_c0_g1_i4.p1  ORF type:complete len:178 (-),score=13.35 TRINITY_DN165_c0_g1_i4:38-571(-)